MRVLQSGLYAQLNDVERSECDALIRANPYASLARDTPDSEKILRAGCDEKYCCDDEEVIFYIGGGQVLIDMVDLHLVAKNAWSINPAGYAHGKRVIDGKKTTVLMHREILGLVRGDKRIVDHINGIKHDNRRSNLRLCTTAENQRNRGKNSNNTSGFKGAHWNTATGRWKSAIRVDRKDVFLGYFDTPEEAHKAYCAAAAKYHGEFAKSS